MNFHGRALAFAKITTPEIERKAVETDPTLIRHCRHADYELAKKVVLIHPALYLDVPEAMRSEEVKLAAASTPPWEWYNYTWQRGCFAILEHIESPSADVIEAAVSSYALNYTYVPENQKSLSLSIRAVKSEPDLMSYTPLALRFELRRLISSNVNDKHQGDAHHAG